MKFKNTLIAVATLLSSSAFAVTDGTYHCRSTSGLREEHFVIKTLDLQGEKIPFLDITRTIRTADPTQKEKVYRIRGFASEHISEGFSESLKIGSLIIELVDGKPNCH